MAATQLMLEEQRSKPEDSVAVHSRQRIIENEDVRAHMIERVSSQLPGIALILTLAASFSACTTVETRSFNVKKDAQVESAQIVTDADFSRYDSLLPQEAGFYSPESSPALAEDMRRIRKLFRDAFLVELRGYTITDRPGPRTMAVQPTLIDMRASSSGDGVELRKDLQDIARPGSLVFLMELKDSQTGNILARAADSAEAPAISTTAGIETDWRSVERAAQRWARLFREFLDRNMAR